MSKAAITNFAIDLKLKPDGNISILELVVLDDGDRYSAAGLSGMHTEFEQAYKWVQDTVYGYTEQYGVESYGLCHVDYSAKNSVINKLGLLQVDKNAPFDPDKIESYSYILIHSQALDHEQATHLRDTLDDRVLITDQHMLCRLAYGNKALFYALAKDTIPAIVPAQSFTAW
jgi:hypothetical protein